MRLLVPLAALCLLPAFAGCASPAAASRGHTWVQYGVRGVEVRAVTEAARCPDAVIDGQAQPMALRSEPGPDYPVRTCALDLPASARQVEVQGRALALPKADPKTILLLGDTGCRMKGQDFQACNDPSSWPFAQISEKAAALHPDLVVHLGDFLYREAACPAGNAGCAGSPWGDSLAVWEEDLLKPAASLLRGAPWLLLRGNHEECTRAGRGWSRLFDPAPFDAAKGCNPPAAPVRLSLQSLDLVDLDNSSIDHKKLEPDLAREVAAQVGALEAPEGKPLWLFLHRPPFGVVSVKGGKVIGGNRTLAMGLASPPKRLQYYFSGHQHTFQVLDFTDGSAPQIIVGHGATELDGVTPDDMSGLDVAGKTIAASFSQNHQFGFVLLERGAEGWTMTNHDRTGAATMRCDLKAQVVCAALPAAKTASN